MNKILWILVLAVVVGGGYVWWQSSNVPVSDVPSESQPVAENDSNSAGGSPASSNGGSGQSGAVVPENIDVGEVASSPNAPAATISYTGNGYSPASVTIKKGETVRWVNNSSEDTWPASAVHPTHSIYPEKTSADCLGSAFDAGKGLKPGESWDFTFNSTGEWRFHDHLHASKTGVVIVQ
jgi:plastocyanin